MIISAQAYALSATTPPSVQVAKLKASGEIVESWVVSGAVDYLALFVCRDLARYHEITEALLADNDLGVKHIDSHVVLRPLNSFHGVDKTYAIQAGREVRVLVKPEDIDDSAMVVLAHDIAEKIHDSVTYPGQVKVTVVRETRAFDTAK
mgnify:CR=1 FL=1